MRVERLLAPSALPMALGAAGAFVDERTRLGFTTWRSACRATGLSLPSVARFTLELLPTGVVGFLLGGVIVLTLGFFSHTRERMAAHAGCTLAMPAGLLLCASGLPLSVMFGTELALAAGLAALLLFLAQRRAVHP